MKISEIIQESLLIRNYLHTFEDSNENPIDIGLLPVPPFKIGNDIKLIIIGQDPTIRNSSQRGNIDSTLNLDKLGSIKKYIEQICQLLEVNFEQIYATNIFKYFYKSPPADTFEILQAHLSPNLRLLKKEISEFSEAIIVTLGEPVLKLLVKDGHPTKMTYYWDYNSKTKQTNGSFKFISKENNKLDRKIFPIPHQPSSIKEFYSSTLEKYFVYIKSISSANSQ